MKRLFVLPILLALLVAPAFADATTTPVAGGQTVTVQTAPAAPVTSPGAVAAPVAASTTTITTSAPQIIIPWGDWLDAIINQIIIPIMGAVILGFVTWAAARLAPLLPANLRALVNAKNTAAIEQLLAPAIANGLKQAAANAAGQQVKLDANSPAVANAAQYAIDHGPAKLIEWAGGPQAIREKIAARIAMMEQAPAPTVVAVTAQPVVPPAPPAN